jgi:hypothetical protein
MNEKKYLGDPSKIVARSSWERVFMIWCDKNPNVLRWASEEVVVPYISPLDNQKHRYFVDFFVEYIDGKTGEKKQKLVEIKPRAQRLEPKNRNGKSYRGAVETYVVNQAKWKAAEIYAKAHGMEFVVLDEYDLGIVQ